MSPLKMWLLSALVLMPTLSFAEAELLSEAQLCVNIQSKLDRLGCFDTVFTTPIMAYAATIKSDTRTVQWRRASENEALRKEEEGTQFLLGTDGTEGSTDGNLWLTASAIGALPPRPILMLSCIDGISRVELVLGEQLENGSVQVGLDGVPRSSRRWLSDHSGYIFRTGRGLPAIQIMKKILTQPSLSLNSDLAQIDGLQFDVDGLELALWPLRKACRW